MYWMKMWPFKDKLLQLCGFQGYSNFVKVYIGKSLSSLLSVILCHYINIAAQTSVAPERSAKIFPQREFNASLSIAHEINVEWILMWV